MNARERERQCKEIFDLFDKDRDGFINVLEFASIMKSLGTYMSQSECQELFQEADTNGTGKIEFTEFMASFDKKMNELISEKELIEAFRVFDRDGNGLVSAEELYHAITTSGEKMTKDEADKMIKDADVDADGYINYQEFVKLLTSFK